MSETLLSIFKIGLIFISFQFLENTIRENLNNFISRLKRERSAEMCNQVLMAEEREINGNKQFRYACPIGEITVKEYFLKLNQLE